MARPGESAAAARLVRDARSRADQLMVAQGLAASRAQAQQLIMRGGVRVDGAVVHKPGQQVSSAGVMTLAERAHYVSRGGLKLEGALAAFGLPVTGRTAVDVGSSTGGFTDCLLQHGARRVYAIDVGYGQLAWSLRQDPRVVLLERTNIRTLSPEALAGPVDLATVDVSFISLRLVLPVVARLLTPPADAVVLVKPQFEVGRSAVGRGGVVRDPLLREAAVRRIADEAAGIGFAVRGTAPSSLPGSKGNREVFLWLARPAGAPPAAAAGHGS